jgi:hypothetical protein
MLNQLFAYASLVQPHLFDRNQSLNQKLAHQFYRYCRLFVS